MTGSEEASVAVGAVRHEWCPHCLKNTLQAATISAATSQAVHVIGGYAVCEECGWSPYAQQPAAPSR